MASVLQVAFVIVPDTELGGAAHSARIDGIVLLMPSMTVDLSNLDDLLHARAVISSRITELGGAPGADEEAQAGDDATDSPDEGLPTGTTKDFADDFWSSVNAANTKNLIWAFTTFEGEFTLEDVAEKLGVTTKEIRAKKLRIGRTEKKLGHRLLDSDWRSNEWMYSYEMNPTVRRRFQELLADAADGWPLPAS